MRNILRNSNASTRFAADAVDNEGVPAACFSRSMVLTEEIPSDKA